MYGGLSPGSGESMLTGSPQSAFGTPSFTYTPSTPKTPFLPPYLLGPGHQTPAASENSQRNFLNRSGQQNASLLSPATNQHRVTWSPDLVQRIPPATSSISRFGGPPTRTLDSAWDTNRREEHIGETPLDHLDGSCLTGSQNGLAVRLTGSQNGLAASQHDQFYSDGEDSARPADVDTWVTVFGFPADAAKYILKEFSTYGTIVQHEFASKGNWVHIRYESPMQVRKALSKNGHLYAQNTIRVGVTTCIDKEVIKRRKTPLPSDSDDVGAKRLKTSASASRIPGTETMPANNRLFSRFDTSTPVRTGPLPAIQRFDTSSTVASPGDSLNRSSRIGNMRSLAAAYDRSPSKLVNGIEHQQVNGTNGNLLSKAWKYIFSS